MNWRFFARFSCIAGVAVAFGGCSMVDQSQIDTSDYPRSIRDGQSPQAPWLRDDSTIFDGLSIRNTLMGEGIDQNRLPVNKYLWRASLDTLSFLPVASIDTFSGVIATDWGASAGNANERVRVTTYVRDADLTAAGLDVSVFRETLSPGGVWQTAAVDPATARQLEDAILTRARQLRIEDVDS